MRAMKTLMLIAAVGLLAGCTMSRQITAADGRAAHRITCNGGANSMGSCFEKAGDICGASGYDVLNQDGSSTPFSQVSGRWSPAGGQINGQSWNIVNRSLMVRCRAQG